MWFWWWICCMASRRESCTIHDVLLIPDLAYNLICITAASKRGKVTMFLWDEMWNQRFQAQSGSHWTQRRKPVPPWSWSRVSFRIFIKGGGANTTIAEPRGGEEDCINILNTFFVSKEYYRAHWLSEKEILTFQSLRMFLVASETKNFGLRSMLVSDIHCFPPFK